MSLDVRYQLVLQFQCNAIEDYDALISLEGYLEKALRGTSFVDGHDAGRSEFNIFVHTDTPEETFAQLKPVLAASKQLSNLRAAFRKVGSDAFLSVWPVGDSNRFVVS